MKNKDINRIKELNFYGSILISVIRSLNIPGVDQELLKCIMDCSFEFFWTETILSHYIERFSTDHKELTELYSNALDRTKDLCLELEFSDPIEIYELYYYLYINGFLSTKHRFEFKNSNNDISNLLGVQVVNGYGVCRHISSYLCDLYKKFGFKSDIICGFADGYDLTDEQAFKIFQRIISKVIPVPNHIVTSVIDENRKMVLDPTNDLLLSYDSEYKFYRSDRAILAPKKALALLVKLVSAEDSMLVHKNIKTNITEEEFKEITEKSSTVIAKNKALFEEFYRNNKKLYRDIKRLSDEYVQPNLVSFRRSKKKKSK